MQRRISHSSFGVIGLGVLIALFTNYSYVQAEKLPTPAAPKISTIESVKTSNKTFDLKIGFVTSKGGSSLPIISTVVTATGRTCSASGNAQSCTIRGVAKNTRITISAKSRNKNGTSSSSSPVRYIVGSVRWSLVTTSSTSTSTTIVSSVRTYNKFIPSSYSKNSAVPLVMLLHGYGASGALQESYMKFEAVAEQNGFILVYPDGTIDSTGKQFWNATDACCNFFSEVDDDSYLVSVVKEMESNYSINPKRIYFVGHSNGGFMSYRMACKHSDLIAAVASLAGASFFKSTDCAPKNPVSVLQVHGTNDGTILFDGGDILGKQYPSATGSALQWATFDQCAQSAVVRSTKLDLESTIAGQETSITAWTNCQNSTEVELWTVDKAGHIPTISSTFASKIYEFLAAHPKP